MLAVCAPKVILLVSVLWRRRSGSKTCGKPSANVRRPGWARAAGSRAPDRAGAAAVASAAAASLAATASDSSRRRRIASIAITPPTEVVARIIRWTSNPSANASSREMPKPSAIPTTVSSNVPTKPGPAGTIETSATPLVRRAACASDSSTPTAWPAARNVPVEAAQARALKASAATSVRGRPATARPSRSLRASSRTRGQRAMISVTRAAPGSRCAAIPRPRPITSNDTNATPSSTALLITPRTLSTTTASAAIATTITVSTTRSTTTVPRTVVRLTSSPSPRA